MLFQVNEAEQDYHQRTKSFGGRRTTAKTLRPISVSKKELAHKLTEQTMGSGRPKPRKTLQHDASFDRLLRE